MRRRGSLKEGTRHSILLIEDDKVLNDLVVQQLGQVEYSVHGVYSWAEAEAYLSEHEPHLIILDPRLPDADALRSLPRLVAQQPVIVLTAYGTVKSAVQAMHMGAVDYLVKPINLDELELVIQRALETAALRRDHQFYKTQIANRRPSFLVGHSAQLAQVESMIDSVAPTDMTVLIQGESGVGKELVAHEIHERSNRAKRNFVALDCCTLQETLFESDLFGHEKGSFTGADRQKKGLIEGAEGGTLFLDEIGEISPSIQAKLLRVLETGKFRRVGGTKDLNANVRILAATNADLEREARDGGFRADLYYRLSSFMIHVPPLRERREDIPDLASHFISKHDFSRRINKAISGAAMKRLIAYDWPGNVRELKNVVERAIILSRNGQEIGPAHLTFGNSKGTSAQELVLSFDHEPTLEELREQYLQMLLDKYSGHRSDVAKTLGISERNTYRLIQKYGLQK